MTASKATAETRRLLQQHILKN